MAKWQIYKEFDYFNVFGGGWYGLVRCPNCKWLFKFPVYGVAEQFVARAETCPHCGEEMETFGEKKELEEIEGWND